MAANIQFLVGGFGFPINNLSGSGLAFFGSGGFGTSVAVGSYQDTTYVSNGAGVAIGPQCNNVKFVHSASGQVQGGTILSLLSIPNYQSTLNIRFTNDTAVKVQNATVAIYDRTNTNNAASGVTTAVCALIHPDTNQTATGSGSSTWEFPSGSSVCYLSRYSNGVAFSPGPSGYGINGGQSTSTQHDFYLCVSQSPNSIGAKTLNGLYAALEYL